MFLDLIQVQELTDIAKSDGFTVAGILMAINVISISVAIFFYREKNKIFKDYINELKAQNEITLKMNNEYNAFANSLKEAYKTKSDV